MNALKRWVMRTIYGPPSDEPIQLPSGVDFRERRTDPGYPVVIEDRLDVPRESQRQQLDFEDLPA